MCDVSIIYGQPPSKITRENTKNESTFTMIQLQKKKYTRTDIFEKGITKYSRKAAAQPKI